MIRAKLVEKPQNPQINPMFQLHSATKNKNENITIVDGQNSIKLPVREIVFVQAEHVYVRIHLANGRQLLHRLSLGSLMKKLPKSEFLQVHRSYLVNTRWVNHWDKQSVQVQGQIIPVSRSRRKHIDRLLTSN